jgi:hypothetical protein
LGPEATDEMIMQKTTETARVCWQLMRDTAEREGVPLLENGTEAMDLTMGSLELPMEWLGWSFDEFPGPAWSNCPQSPTDALRPTTE